MIAKKELKSIKKEVLWCDIIVWTTFILMILIRFLTVFSFNRVVELTQAKVDNTISFVESNPIASAIFKMQGISFMLQFIIIPGGFMTLYYYFRNRVKKGTMNVESLSLFSNFGFFTLILNILGDSATLLALYLR